LCAISKHFLTELLSAFDNLGDVLPQSGEISDTASDVSVDIGTFITTPQTPTSHRLTEKAPNKIIITLRRKPEAPKATDTSPAKPLDSASKKKHKPPPTNHNLKKAPQSSKKHKPRPTKHTPQKTSQSSKKSTPKRKRPRSPSPDPIFSPVTLPDDDRMSEEDFDDYCRHLGITRSKSGRTLIMEGKYKEP